jgi:aerobic-type carbon monoxide dehydrogenase small subunit (CoxS/CutS family)
MAGKIAFKLNDKPVELDVDGDRKLLWVLRTELGLTGTKFSCGEGHCGSCTVLVNGVATRSCITKMKTLAGKEVVTIEGLARNGKLHPLQRAFMECDGFQCGFCTPGMIVTGAALLASNPRLTRDEILRGMEQNLCRCGAHARIVQAMEKAGQEMAGKGLGG